MPPHSSTGAASGSRPWITSHTSDPTMPTLGTGTSRMEERECGAVHPRGLELARQDAAGGHRRLERPAGDFPPERHEEEVAGAGHAAADDHGFRIEDVDEVGDAGAEKAG